MSDLIKQTLIICTMIIVAITIICISMNVNETLQCRELRQYYWQHQR